MAPTDPMQINEAEAVVAVKRAGLAVCKNAAINPIADLIKV